MRYFILLKDILLTIFFAKSINVLFRLTQIIIKFSGQKLNFIKEVFFAWVILI